MKPRSKYRAVPTTVDGIRFHSKKEAARYAELKLLQKAGMITDLELQPAFPVAVNGKKVCVYRADFRYWEPGRRACGEQVIEDVKGMRTPLYKLKKALVEALYGIQIREV